MINNFLAPFLKMTIKLKPTPTPTPPRPANNVYAGGGKTRHCFDDLFHRSLNLTEIGRFGMNSHRKIATFFTFSTIKVEVFD